MATAIYKYELDLFNLEQEIQMPTGSQVLSVQEQDGKLCLWALVPTDTKSSAHRFQVLVIGTMRKDQVPSVRGFIGTVGMMDGAYVVHVFKDFR